MQKIVTIGGGTGQYQILRGLKNYECDITAVVNMSDDGGSSGRLRDEFGILPPGDARQCLVALCDEDKGRIWRDIFGYRFGEEGQNHSLGNLIIKALTMIRGGTAQGIKEAGNILGIRGKVLPATIDDVVLNAETESGELIFGQKNVSFPKEGDKIKRIYYEPEALIYHESAKAIRDAEKIVICPGDLYGSILTNFLIRGMPEALRDSRAMKIYVCNLFTKEGTHGFKASDFLMEIERYARTKIDKVIINKGKPTDEVIAKYLSEKSGLVEDDLGEDRRIARGDYVAVYPSEQKTILRHVPEKIARKIMAL